MLNAAGYYTEPTAQNVAVSLLAAQVDTTDVNDPAKYLTENLTGVYTDPDPRTYPLSSYCYLILPTTGPGPVHHGQGQHPGRVLLLRHVPGPTAVGLPRATRPCPSTWWRPASTRSRRSPGANVQNINIQSVQQPDLLAERNQPPGRYGTAAAGLRQAGADPVHLRHRRGGATPRRSVRGNPGVQRLTRGRGDHRSRLGLGGRLGRRRPPAAGGQGRSTPAAKVAAAVIRDLPEPTSP